MNENPEKGPIMLTIDQDLPFETELERLFYNVEEMALCLKKEEGVNKEKISENQILLPAEMLFPNEQTRNKFIEDLKKIGEKIDSLLKTIAVGSPMHDILEKISEKINGLLEKSSIKENDDDFLDSLKDENKTPIKDMRRIIAIINSKVREKSLKRITESILTDKIAKNIFTKTTFNLTNAKFGIVGFNRDMEEYEREKDSYKFFEQLKNFERGLTFIESKLAELQKIIIMLSLPGIYPMALKFFQQNLKGIEGTSTPKPNYEVEKYIEEIGKLYPHFKAVSQLNYFFQKIYDEQLSLDFEKTPEVAKKLPIEDVGEEIKPANEDGGQRSLEL